MNLNILRKKILSIVANITAQYSCPYVNMLILFPDSVYYLKIDKYNYF